MNKNTNNIVTCSLTAPLTGKLIPLDRVPDTTFSEKVLGDGIAIIPEDGKILSPVTGRIESIADTKHAFSIVSENGLNILIHIGLETVALKGEGFKTFVKEGDSVKAGELIGEVNLEFLKKKNINPITPVLICDAPEGLEINSGTGKAVAG